MNDDYDGKTSDSIFRITFRDDGASANEHGLWRSVHLTRFAQVWLIVTSLTVIVSYAH